jgi:hypothetical protein
MFINLKTSSLTTKESFFETAYKINSPAILADGSFKIIAKTKSVNNFLCGVRKGTKLTRFLPEKAVFEIENMQAESIFRTEFLTSNGDFGVVVIRKEDSYLILFDRLFSELLKSANEVYGKMSGYDNELDGENWVFAYCSDKLKELLGDILASLKISKGLPFFEAVSVVRHIESKLEKATIEKEIAFEISDERLLTTGNKKDFAAAIVILVAFLLKSGRNISVKLNANDEIIALSVLGNGDFLPFERLNVRSFLDGFETYKDNRFLLYLVKLISDANLWDFKTVSENGFSGFRLVLPFIKSGEEFLLREEENDYIDELIESFIQ